jgi:hypothetical protein
MYVPAQVHRLLFDKYLPLMREEAVHETESAWILPLFDILSSKSIR